MSGEAVIERIVAELEKIAFADYSEINRAFSGDEAEAYIKCLVRLEQYLPAVSQIKSVKDGVEIKFYDKLKALELLGRYVRAGGDEGEGDYDNLLEVLKLKAEHLWKGGDTD